VKGKQFIRVEQDNTGRRWIDGLFRAKDFWEAEKLHEDCHGGVVEVGDGEFLILLDERLIEALRKALIKNGYNVPETEIGWSDVVNELLEEKIIEDFGEEVLETE